MIDIAFEVNGGNIDVTEKDLTADSLAAIERAAREQGVDPAVLRARAIKAAQTMQVYRSVLLILHILKRLMREQADHPAAARILRGAWEMVESELTGKPLSRGASGRTWPQVSVGILSEYFSHAGNFGNAIECTRREVTNQFSLFVLGEMEKDLPVSVDKAMARLQAQPMTEPGHG